MLSPQLRREVDRLWTMFWSSGMTNPLTSIEQITYLLFLKMLEELDASRVAQGRKSIYGPRANCMLPHHPQDEQNDVIDLSPVLCAGHEACRWSYIRQGSTFAQPDGTNIGPHEHLSRYVFPWLRALPTIIKETGGEAEDNEAADAPLEDAYFQLPPEKTETLQRAIGAVDRLFQSVGKRSANADIMGDIFEYLLEEIKSSGKNGQFRTPRHIIRFLIALLDPQPGETIVDPAAGTGGFLINSIQYLLAQQTDPETLKLEWDGTPHRNVGGAVDVEKYLGRDYFTGYDNDRTMVRIGWMNMLLHGIENPRMKLRDTLGKGFTEREQYDIVLANPPFTGQVDADDLNRERFPSRGKDVLTNKSELLFLWLMLDLLKLGGRAAVIVPDGVLFGSTAAHRELRHQLVRDHRLLAVVSLPAGVFQPYTAVKTSILVFQRSSLEPRVGQPPLTENVWFYEVTADGYTLDAKRSEKRLPNDIWDAEVKNKTKAVETTEYYQPEIFLERWRTVDDDMLKVFPELASEKDRTLAIHELFPDLPSDPEMATDHLVRTLEGQIQELYRLYLFQTRPVRPSQEADQEIRIYQAAKRAQGLNRQFTDWAKQWLDTEFARFGRQALDTVLLPVLDKVTEHEANEMLTPSTPPPYEPDYFSSRVQTFIREFAKLDGYNIRLRSHAVSPVKTPNPDIKSWAVPVRTWARQDDWQSEDGKVSGSHDKNGAVYPEYIQAAYAAGRAAGLGEQVRPDFLDPLCIEANDFNLAAGRYKPLNRTVADNTDLPALLDRLQKIENDIQDGLKNLQELVRVSSS